MLLGHSDSTASEPIPERLRLGHKLYPRHQTHTRAVPHEGKIKVSLSSGFLFKRHHLQAGGDGARNMPRGGSSIYAVPCIQPCDKLRARNPKPDLTRTTEVHSSAMPHPYRRCSLQQATTDKRKFTSVHASVLATSCTLVLCLQRDKLHSISVRFQPATANHQHTCKGSLIYLRT